MVCSFSLQMSLPSSVDFYVSKAGYVVFVSIFKLVFSGNLLLYCHLTYHYYSAKTFNPPTDTFPAFNAPTNSGHSYKLRF